LFFSITFQNTSKVLADIKIAEKGGWFIVEDLEKRLQVKLRARRAYPGTYCHTLQNGTVVLGYGPTQPSTDDEFLQVLITPQGDITITRDVICTMPLFYGQAHGNFAASNDYESVCSVLAPFTVDIPAVASKLLDPSPAESSTIWKEVGILGERKTLRLHQAKLAVITPPPRSWTYNSELPKTNAREFPRRLTEHFNRFTQTRLAGNRVGFELSGGLDSSFLPLFLAQQGHSLGHSQASSVIQIDPKDRARQLQKITELEGVTGLRSHRVSLEPQAHYPLRHMLSTGKFRPIHIEHEIYEPAISEMADYFKSQGVEVVVGGAGGDQLVEHRPHPSRRLPSPGDENLPPFMKTQAKALFSARDPFAPVPTLLSPSLVSEHVAASNIYIERDIWPVSPFHNVKLFNYCQALPVQFRSEKNIYKAYFEASNFPLIIYRAGNENFGPFFDNCWHLGFYDALAQQLLQHSVLQKLGLIDPEKLQDVLRTKAVDHLFHAYVWLVLELNLQLVSNRYK
jgi:hypothetical protein